MEPKNWKAWQTAAEKCEEYHPGGVKFEEHDFQLGGENPPTRNDSTPVQFEDGKLISSVSLLG